MDKSPMATLTLEDFLESERHKLSGKLTPVTPETFAKWKSERMDKKQAEEAARKAKEATGRALFESGNWRTADSDDEEDDEAEAEDDGVWNLEKLRKETEKAQLRREEERLANGWTAGREDDGSDETAEGSGSGSRSIEGSTKGEGDG